MDTPRRIIVDSFGSKYILFTLAEMQILRIVLNASTPQRAKGSLSDRLVQASMAMLGVKAELALFTPLTKGQETGEKDMTLTATDIQQLQVALKTSIQQEVDDVERKRWLQDLAEKLVKISAMLDTEVQSALLEPLPESQAPTQEGYTDTDESGYPRHYEELDALKEYGYDAGVVQARIQAKPEDQKLEDYAKDFFHLFLKDHTVSASIQEAAPDAFQEQFIQGYQYVTRHATEM